MKSLLFLFGALLLTSTIQAEADGQLNKRDVTCESILSVKVCTKFRDTATTLKLKADAIETAIQDAYRKGITKAEEIKKSVEKFLQETVLSKSCEDILGKTACDGLDSAAKYLNKKVDDLKPYIAKAIAEGASLATDITNKVTDYVRNDLMTKTCEDFFTKAQCQQFDDIGKSLKLKADEIKKATIEGILKGYNKVEETVKSTFESMKKYAENFTCEELLNPDICKDLRSYANKLGVAMPKLMSAVRSAIVMGYKAGTGLVKAVYKIVDAFYDCEDFISPENCVKIKETATKIGASLTKVSEAINNAVSKGIAEAQKIYESAKKYLTNLFGRKRRSLSDKGVNDIISKYENVVNEAMKQADKYFEKHVKKILLTLGETNLKLKEAIKKALLAGGDLDELKKVVKELFVGKGENGLEKRGILDIRENLRNALKYASETAKKVITKILEKPTLWLLSHAREITEWLSKNIKTKGEVFDERADEIIDELNDEVQMILEDVVDQVDSAVESVVSHHVQKRSTTNEVYLRKVVYDMIKKYTNDAFEKLTLSTPDIVNDVMNLVKRSPGKVVNLHQLTLESLKKYA